MADIIGNIAAGIGLVSAFITLIYNSAANDQTRTLQWFGVTFIMLVIVYAAIPFR